MKDLLNTNAGDLVNELKEIPVTTTDMQKRQIEILMMIDRACLMVAERVGEVGDYRVRSLDPGSVWCIKRDIHDLRIAAGSTEANGQPLADGAYS